MSLNIHNHAPAVFWSICGMRISRLGTVHLDLDFKALSVVLFSRKAIEIFFRSATSVENKRLITCSLTKSTIRPPLMKTIVLWPLLS